MSEWDTPDDEINFEVNAQFHSSNKVSLVIMIENNEMAVFEKVMTQQEIYNLAIHFQDTCNILRNIAKVLPEDIR